MNIDILKKLIALANNNPNEHEANSAARRVCRMLADAIDKGQLNFKKKEEGGTWNDVRRSSEPEIRSTPPNTSSQRAADFWDIMNEMKRAAERVRKEKDRDRYSPLYDEDNPYVKYEPWSTTKEWKPPRPPKEKRALECTKCHITKETIFVGHYSQFVCNDCIWANYEATKS